ncbi:hypothetical protein FHR81_003085 [Actinoalloteichus hoggarensis]|uniref:Uncharacterized protein n=1 Tax=Actinoalloteichus hoggarensis TaxID=1470176 RepID=A0A221W6S4_9PSEU|nr:hypothetical protein [Actinoalloteichus hoggarensis]ASO21444.1 hypothetical protein AHOG_19110 [Actinoalloteichus hoggarensis]MBB5922033.1 hypothetical protein [Actinoalloteichus hoggarensis]
MTAALTNSPTATSIRRDRRESPGPVVRRRSIRTPVDAILNLSRSHRHESHDLVDAAPFCAVAGFDSSRTPHSTLFGGGMT